VATGAPDFTGTSTPPTLKFQDATTYSNPNQNTATVKTWGVIISNPLGSAGVTKLVGLVSLDVEGFGGSNASAIVTLTDSLGQTWTLTLSTTSASFVTLSGSIAGPPSVAMGDISATLKITNSSAGGPAQVRNVNITLIFG
jgi:hypothetical protein